MARWLRALRPFLSFGWLLGVVFAVGFVAAAADAWRVVLSERHASALSCAEWAHRTQRPAWVRLHGCRLLADQRIPLNRRNKVSVMPAPVLVPLTANGSSAPVAYVKLPKEFDRDPTRVQTDSFAGLTYPLSDFYTRTTYDRSLPVLHPGEPSIAVLALSALPLAWLSIAFARRLGRNLRAVDASDRLARRVRDAPAAPVDIVDISPLLALRRAVLVTAPCWMLAALLLVLVPVDSGLWTLTLGAVVGAAIVAAVLLLWRRARPSRVAWAACIAPLGLIAISAAGLIHSNNAIDDMLLALALLAYGMLSAALLVRALTRLRRDPDRARLLEIERAWLSTKRRMRIRLKPGRARTRYLVLHAFGIVLGTITSFVLLALGMGGWGIGIGIGIFLVFRTWARRYALPDAAEALADDARAPVLYLRSFMDEDRTVQPRFYRWDRSISELVAAQFNLVGPVIAIAKPGERLPEIGPYRIRLPASEDWQAEVRACLDRSAAIVLVFGTTQGLLWELREIVGRGALARTFFVFPPIDSIELDWRWQQIDAQVAVVPQLEALRAIDPHDLLMAAIGAGGRLTVFSSALHMQASYEMAFAATWLLCYQPTGRG